MTLSATDAAAQFAADINALDRIRLRAKTDPRGAMQGVAQQFEALLYGMLLKSMREASPRGSMFDSDQTRLFQSLLDQQFAQLIAARGTGVAAMLMRQLAPAGPPISSPAAMPGISLTPGATVADGSLAPETTASFPPTLSIPFSELDEDTWLELLERVQGQFQTAPRPESARSPAAASTDIAPSVREFVDRMWPHALSAGRETGIPPHFILAQAALESGWGKSEIRGADGASSHNLFGIKAGRGWSGATAEAVTTEYVNGAPQRMTERFRSYSSYREAFLDYARLLKSQPRYAQVIEYGKDAEAFARGLQRAGYATDPMYADKLLRIINGSILRSGLATG